MQSKDESEKIKEVQRYMRDAIRDWSHQWNPDKTITDFSRECGVKRSTLNAALNGTNAVSYDVCLAVARVLAQSKTLGGRSGEDVAAGLFAITGYPFPVPEDPIALDIARNWHKYTDDQKQQLARFVKNLQGDTEGDDGGRPFLLSAEVV